MYGNISEYFDSQIGSRILFLVGGGQAQWGEDKNKAIKFLTECKEKVPRKKEILTQSSLSKVQKPPPIKSKAMPPALAFVKVAGTATLVNWYRLNFFEKP